MKIIDLLFNCENYIIDTISSSTELDTFYIEKMKIIKIYMLNFIEKLEVSLFFIIFKKIFDEEYGCGIDFNSRFPPLNIIIFFSNSKWEIKIWNGFIWF